MKEKIELPNVWLTPQECADRLGVSRRTLQAWRSAKKGPPYHKEDQLLRYHVEEVDNWLLEK